MIGDDAFYQIAASATIERQRSDRRIDGKSRMQYDGRICGQDPRESILIVPRAVRESPESRVGSTDRVCPPARGDVMSRFTFGQPQILTDRRQVRTVQRRNGNGAGERQRRSRCDPSPRWPAQSSRQSGPKADPGR